MKDWKNIKIDGVNEIEKVVAEFNIHAMQKLPFFKFKVKVRESSTGGYCGSPNVAVRSQIDNEPDWTSGFGHSIAEALEDTIVYFFKTLEGIDIDNLTEDDFVWSDIHDF